METNPPGNDGEIITEDTSPNTHKTAFALLEIELPHGRVLDIPCGHGAFTKRLLDNHYEVIAADCLENCQVKNAEFLKADMNLSIPLEDHSVDAVVCLDGIEHLERPFDFIAECKRIIKDDGVVIISTPNISSLRSRWRWLFTGFHNKDKTPLDETNPSPWHHIHMLPYHKLRYMLHREGFRIINIATNRIKPVNWLYSPLILPSFLLTQFVFLNEEKDPGQRRRNKEILRQMFSKQMLFGETLIVKAKAGTGQPST